jgi:hypothetical protein
LKRHETLPALAFGRGPKQSESHRIHGCIEADRVSLVYS